MLATISPSSPSTSLSLLPLGSQRSAQLRQGSTLNAVQPILALAFDGMRHHYAGAVTAGFVPRSLLDSARMERCLGALEGLMLGPLARMR